ncbi:hypothetical protein SNOG_03019 [Parastagonospora nodorum SN15]|uniref:Dynein light intermediate chain n=1 Tax=Phaeosphaeria nodorum (strain SN15 / ATCC MYA-4574 / FGSC 10173) TaxID=321614 RepID=Q0UYZ5_PHANO|nr:hypothetical protein SNOG_03019 [Parastagonospora nodorum SN15]EAT89750.2 hypothetical protein SNOG_03019 [Parastagonospora nodorum SN15]
MASAHRTSNFPSRTHHDRPNSRDTEKEEIWKPMLDNISSGKRLPEKSLLVLGEAGEGANEGPGGTPETQREFLESVSTEGANSRRPPDRGRKPPIANQFALGYTYQDVLDTDHEVLEENIQLLQDKGRSLGAEGTSSMEDVKIPLGPGEWDEPLGIPLCVVCQNADKIESLEKERGWKEEEFDFILQYLRTILLKHGSSLVYTMPTAPGSLQTLIHSTLGIKSLLKQEQLRHNVTDRDRVLVPPNWDSWAKIRILREGFDVEGVSERWSVDIEIPRHMRIANGQTPASAPVEAEGQANGEPEPSPVIEEEQQDGPSATSIYEDTIRNPESDYPLSAMSRQSNGIEVTSKDPQVFLNEQVTLLETLRREDENEAAMKAARKESDTPAPRTYMEDASGVVEEHIGPVQFNMGGIQVNADEMVKRLQDREANRGNEPGSPPATQEAGKMDNEKLMSFFSGLLNKGPGGSPRGA